MTVKTIHNGTQIYVPFPYPEDLTGYDMDIVENTLGYYEFIARMSDNYQNTLDELEVINDYREKHNIGGK